MRFTSKETGSMAQICLLDPGFGTKFKGLGGKKSNLEADWLVSNQPI